MSDIKIPEGETEKVITAGAAKKYAAYNVQIYSGRVQYDHDQGEVQNGLFLDSGLTHPLSNLRGEPLYFHAVDGYGDVECRIRPAAAEVRTLPTKSVEIENVDVGASIDIEDRQPREIGKARIMDSGGVLVDPPTEQKQDQIISLLEQIEANTSP